MVVIHWQETCQQSEQFTSFAFLIVQCAFLAFLPGTVHKFLELVPCHDDVRIVRSRLGSQPHFVILCCMLDIHPLILWNSHTQFLQ